MGQSVRKIYQVIDDDTGNIIYEITEYARRSNRYEMSDEIRQMMTELGIGVKEWLRIMEVTPAKIQQYGTTMDSCRCGAARNNQDKPCKHQVAVSLGTVSV